MEAHILNHQELISRFGLSLVANSLSEVIFRHACSKESKNFEALISPGDIALNSTATDTLRLNDFM